MTSFIYVCSECLGSFRVRIERSEPCALRHDAACCHHDEEPVENVFEC